MKTEKINKNANKSTIPIFKTRLLRIDLNMTEQQAHRYIEKQSMDMRQSRLITAQKILKTYEL